MLVNQDNARRVVIASGDVVTSPSWNVGRRHVFART
jgi:hypothetical protein